jgi:uncharacterized membrane protein YqaE (UPF0057 family)
MRYFLAILLPPAALLLCGEKRGLWANVPLTACLWLPGVVHALRVVRRTAQEERADRVAEAVLAREEQLRRDRRRARAARYAALQRR